MATFDEEVKKPCENCKQLFPESKVQLHEAYCLRNIRKCPNCENYIDKREMEEHNEEFHKKVTCDKCGQSVENQTLMQKHIETQCQLRPRQCRYCNVKIPVQEFEQHEYVCGCRTKVCQLCEKNILARDYEDHMDTCVGIVEKVESKKIEKVENKPKAPVVPTGPNQPTSYPSSVSQQNKGSNIPSSYPQSNNINQILKNEREKELQKKAAEEAQAALKKKQEEEKAAQQRNSLQNQRDAAVNKPTSQYPSSSSQQQLYQQQQQRVPVQPTSIASNLEKNKLSNETKPVSQVPSSYGSKYPSSSQSQQGQTNINRPSQAEEKALIDKYNQKPLSSQGQRQPLIGNKQVNQEIPPNMNKPQATGIPAQNQYQQPVSSYQKKQDDIYGGRGAVNKVEMDIYGQKKEDPRINNNIYNARINQKSSIPDAEKQRIDNERLKDQKDLANQYNQDNIKTVKNPLQYDYKIPDSGQQKSTSNQPPLSYQQGRGNVQPPSGIDYKQSVPSSQQPTSYNKPPSTQYSYPSSQQYPTSITGQNPQSKQKLGVSNPTAQNVTQQTNIQSKNIQPPIQSQKQAPTKPAYDINSGVGKNPPTGYKNHEEILRNVPSQGISGIPNYQPITKPGMAPSTGSSSSSSNQRVPSRGKYDSKPTYPSSSSSQSKPLSNNKLEALELEDDTELQKAILKSLHSDQQKISSNQNVPSQARQPSLKNNVATQIKPPSTYPQQNKPQGGGGFEDDEELQKAIMESMKNQGGMNKKQAPANKPPGNSKPLQQQYGQYGGGNFDEEYDEEYEKAILQSYQQK